MTQPLFMKIKYSHKHSYSCISKEDLKCINVPVVIESLVQYDAVDVFKFTEILVCDMLSNQTFCYL